MGWLYSTRWDRKGLIAHLIKPWDNGIVRTECLRHCTVGNHLWTVFVQKDMETGEERERFICLFLMQNGGFDHGWGYKDVEESMGPCEVTCPLAYLDLAPNPSNDYSREWRERVRAHHARTQGLKVGDQVMLSNGWEVKIIQLRPLRCVHNGCTYRLSKKLIRERVPVKSAA